MFFQMATFTPFKTKKKNRCSRPPPVHLNTFRKVKVVWGQMVPHTAVVSLFGRAWEGRGLSLPRSTYKQQLVFTATFPISAEGRSCNSHFIALRGHVKDKASSPVNKTNVLTQTLWSLMEGSAVSFKGPLRTPRCITNNLIVMQMDFTEGLWPKTVSLIWFLVTSCNWTLGVPRGIFLHRPLAWSFSWVGTVLLTAPACSPRFRAVDSGDIHTSWITSQREVVTGALFSPGLDKEKARCLVCNCLISYDCFSWTYWLKCDSYMFFTNANITSVFMLYF